MFTVVGLTDAYRGEQRPTELLAIRDAYGEHTFTSAAAGELRRPRRRTDSRAHNNSAIRRTVLFNKEPRGTSERFHAVRRKFT